MLQWEMAREKKYKKTIQFFIKGNMLSSPAFATTETVKAKTETANY